MLFWTLWVVNFIIINAIEEYMWVIKLFFLVFFF
jgi:hypothetical protein